MIIQAPTASVLAMRSPRSEAAPRQRDIEARVHRERWARKCAARLRELRPDDDVAPLVALAEELCDELSFFDPVLAAEMEHEAWR